MGWAFWLGHTTQHLPQIPKLSQVPNTTNYFNSQSSVFLLHLINKLANSLISLAFSKQARCSMTLPPTDHHTPPPLPHSLRAAQSRYVPTGSGQLSPTP